MVFPAVIEEGDATIDGFVDDGRRGVRRVFRVAKVMATEAQGRNFGSGTAEIAKRDRLILCRHDGRLYSLGGDESLGRSW